MSSPHTVSQPRIVDNPPPDALDVDRLGKSRIGRKLRRKALDRYHSDLRRYEGRAAKTGPPIPNSEKRGRREFYTLDQERLGGRRSGVTRRRQAQPRWRQVMTLRRRGFGIRQIARAVGYTAGWVSKLVKRLMASPAKVFPEHIHHQPQPTPRALVPAASRVSWKSRALSLMLVHCNHLCLLLREDLPPLHKARAERLLKRYRKRIIKYLRKVHEKEPRGVAENIYLGIAFKYQRVLSGLPIDAAVRKLNSEFGW